MASYVATRLAFAGAIVCSAQSQRLSGGSRAAAKSLSTVDRSEQCDVELYLKRDCSRDAQIDQAGCEAKGCCWATKDPDHRWLPECVFTTDTASPPTPTPSPPPAGEFGRSPVVYQISTRPWLYELAQAGIPANCGDDRTDYVCLRDVPDAEWQKIKDDSTDMVWLMGVWQLGLEGLQVAFDCSGCRTWYESQVPDLTDDDVIGSPYAVQDYTLNSDIGNDEDLDAVKAKLNSMGMGLMVDFVPNHFARDSVLFENHPEAFIERPVNDTTPDEWWHTKNGRTVAYGRGPYDGPWTDTLNINYWSPAAEALISDLFVNVTKRVDAVRLDMAMLPLNTVWENAWADTMAKGGWTRPETEFWADAIAAAKVENPGLVIVAETYDYYMTFPMEEVYLTQLGVDYSYEKQVLDRIHERDFDKMKSYFFPQPQWKFDRMCHFVENHDEPRSARNLGGPDQAFAGSVAAWTLPGMRLTYFGQFDGLQNRLIVQLRRSYAESRDSDLHARYTTLMGVLAQPIFHEGTWMIIDVPQPAADWRLFAWRWELGDEKRLVVINYCNQTGTGNVQVANVAGHGNVHLEDLLTGDTYDQDASQLRSGSGFAVDLRPWTAHIFTYSDGDGQEDGARSLFGVVPFALILLSLVAK